MPLAAALICLVVGVSDGDSIRVRCEAQAEQPAQTITVRLAQIDAPERGQPSGTRSRQHLAALCFQKQAEVRSQTTDRFRRMVARVECDGADASTEQIRAGLAWVFDRYVTDRALYAAQDDARADRRGLWADADPVAPWQWRRR